MSECRCWLVAMPVSVSMHDARCMRHATASRAISCFSLHHAKDDAEHQSSSVRDSRAMQSLQLKHLSTMLGCTLRVFNVYGVCTQELRAAMPPVVAIQDAPDVLRGAVAALPPPMRAWPLPPHIVAERGDSLEPYLPGSSPDNLTTMNVRPPASVWLRPPRPRHWFVGGDVLASGLQCGSRIERRMVPAVVA